METAVITKEATLMILFDGPSEHVGTSVRYRVSVWPPDFETKARSLGLDTLLSSSSPCACLACSLRGIYSTVQVSSSAQYSTYKGWALEVHRRSMLNRLRTQIAATAPYQRGEDGGQLGCRFLVGSILVHASLRTIVLRTKPLRLLDPC